MDRGEPIVRHALPPAHWPTEAEAARVATATARTNIVERAWRDAFRLEEREATEKEMLESVERAVTTSDGTKKK